MKKVFAFGGVSVVIAIAAFFWVYGTPPTIDDPAILPEIAEALRQVGYARRA